MKRKKKEDVPMNHAEAMIVPQESSQEMTVASVHRQIQLIQEVMNLEMKKGEHYGVIPGCGDKPTLLKAGAEKLSLLFKMAPRFKVETIDLGNGHREVRIVTELYHIVTNNFLGEGLGSCSTMESKYRYRSGDGEPTGEAVPKAYWDKKDVELIGGKGFTAKKIDGQWLICRKGEKVENPDIADVYNTVLKIGKKRSLVDAVLTVTAASDIFTQDIEETAPETAQDKAPAATIPNPERQAKEGSPKETENVDPPSPEEGLPRPKSWFIPMPAKKGGKCSGCADEIMIGEQMYWDPKGRVGYHQEHFKK